MSLHCIDNDYNIYSTKYQLSFKGLLMFELVSLYGRLLLNKKPVLINDNNLLNIGSGLNKFGSTGFSVKKRRRLLRIPELEREKFSGTDDIFENLGI